MEREKCVVVLDEGAFLKKRGGEGEESFADLKKRTGRDPNLSLSLLTRGEREGETHAS